MLETLLSYGDDPKKWQLSFELFYKDDAGNMEETIVAAAGNRRSVVGERTATTTAEPELRRQTTRCRRSVTSVDYGVGPSSV